MKKAKPAYERILLKLSGEILQDPARGASIQPDFLGSLAGQLADVAKTGTELAVVIGGGNFCRGATLTNEFIERSTADNMAMLATAMNGLAIRDAIIQHGQEAVIFSAFPIDGVIPVFDLVSVNEALKQRKVVIFVAGVGHPYFTTDTGASLRAVEIGADILLKGTKVDGVFSADPSKDPSAKQYDQISYQEVITQGLQVMDLTSICLCQENNLPLRVFDITQSGALNAVVQGEPQGTLVNSGESND